MNIDSYIYEAIFEEKPKFKVLYELFWEQFKEDGFVITDESGHERTPFLKQWHCKTLWANLTIACMTPLTKPGLKMLSNTCKT